MNKCLGSVLGSAVLLALGCKAKTAPAKVSTLDNCAAPSVTVGPDSNWKCVDATTLAFADAGSADQVTNASLAAHAGVVSNAIDSDMASAIASGNVVLGVPPPGPPVPNAAAVTVFGRVTEFGGSPVPGLLAAASQMAISSDTQPVVVSADVALTRTRTLSAQASGTVTGPGSILVPGTCQLALMVRNQDAGTSQPPFDVTYASVFSDGGDNAFTPWALEGHLALDAGSYTVFVQLASIDQNGVPGSGCTSSPLPGVVTSWLFVEGER